MSNPEIQYFPSGGTWSKPPGAVRVDIVLRGGGAGNSVPHEGIIGECGGNSSAYIGRLINPNGYQVSSGEPGEIRVSSFDASDLPDTVEVTVGKGGRPSGRDGYALIVTHLDGDEDEDCGCPFDYEYTCPACGHKRITNHCPHDRIQNPCPKCKWTDPGKETPLQFLGVTWPPGEGRQ